MPNKTNTKKSTKHSVDHKDSSIFEPFKITVIVSVIGGVTLVVFAVASAYL